MKFKGNQIKPTKLTNREVAEMLIAFEDAVIGVFKESNPELDNFDKFLKYHDVRDKSFSIRNLIKENQDEIKKAFLVIVSSMVLGASNDLPPESVRALNKINHFSKEKKCTAELGWSNTNGIFTSMAKIVSLKKKQSSSFTERKTLHGKLVKLDFENLKVYFRLLNGSAVKSTINEKQVKEFRQYVGEEVKIQGLVTISNSDYSIKNTFKLEGLESSDLYGISESINAIRKIVS